MDKTQQETISSILARGKDLTLATVRPDGYPQATTVSYVSDGLSVYFGCGETSQKAANIALNAKVSYTVDLPYEAWDEIRSLSAGGHGVRVTDPAEIAKVTALMVEKFPEFASVAPADLAATWLFRIDAKVFSILDYSKGFGHTEAVEV